MFSYEKMFSEDTPTYDKCVRVISTRTAYPSDSSEFVLMTVKMSSDSGSSDFLSAAEFRSVII